jgi:hypothetical protein
MKLLAALLVLACLAPQEEPRVRELIDRLTDDQIRVREQAAVELAELGRVAVPALQRLRDSGDVELRSRAGNILKRIAEGEVIAKHWRRGPRITLSLSNTPVASVLESLEKQAHDTFKVDVDDLQDPVTVEIKDAPFWDAVDTVCRAAPALTWESDGDALHFLKKRRPAYPEKRQGEFAVWLDGITFMRDFDFTGNPRSTFTISLMSAWESGIQPVAIEQRVTEILDEEGTNLVPNDRYSPYGARLDVPKGRTRRDTAYIPLPQNAKVLRKFSRVRGTAAFYFPRAYEELSVDLRGPLNPVVLDRMSVAVRNLRTQAASCSFEVILTTASPPGEALVDRMPSTDISIVDDKGDSHKPPPSSRSHSYSGTSYTIHESLQMPLPEGRTPVTLKLRLLKDVMEKRIAFDFENIPLE